MPCRVFLALAALPLLASLATARATPVDFNREVRPILSDKCYHCHGPDEKGRKAKLRFDTKEGALREKDGVAVILPGRGAASEMILRLTSPHDDEVMPPPDSKLGRLTPAEIALLRRWIDEGAEFQSHWSFQPLDAVAVPAKPQAPLAGVLARNPIDHFVFADLAARQLAPQPEADRATLLRRVSFDLTGLPPTPAEVTAFLQDARPDAYERVVDRLLASPRYGERMAVDWLDLARYADSFGFQVDRERDMWPWRDWVIRAFNSNLRWDQFVTWQLAGDLLPNASDDQILATAFNRLHPQEAEGGSIEEEYRVNYINDRTTTFGTAFLGLTLECARCHDHKFDPISQKDYYQLFAFFDDIDEAGLYSYFTTAMPPPTMWLPDTDHRRRYATATAEVGTAEEKLSSLRESRRAAFAAWLASTPRPSAAAGLAQAGSVSTTETPGSATPATPNLIPGELARFDFDQVAADAPSPSETAAEKSPPDEAEKPKTKNVVRYASAIDAAQIATTPKENESVPGRAGGRALRLTGDHAVNTPLGNFHRHDPFSVSLWIQTPDVKERAVILHRSRAWTDAASRGYELLLEEGRLKWSLIHFWPGDAISVRTVAPVAVNEWVHVTVTNDGSSRAAGLSIYVNGEPAATEVIRDHLTKDITGGGGDTIALGERFRDRGFKGGLVDDLRIFGRQLTALEAREVFAAGTIAALWSRAPATLTPAEHASLFAYYLALHDEPVRTQLTALTTARAAQTQLATDAKDIMVMRELPRPKKAYILRRGDYDQRGEEVQPDTPAALPAFPADAPRNRLGLARWLTEPRHPLLARVTVNRFWQACFGRGLIKTADDLGSQGDRPANPALLDWLAGDFVRSGWDVKALLKTIVLSHTYRQRSFAEGGLMADDPENVLLARGPRHRLPAEMIRDHALAVSGLLVEQVGGPPVHTYDLPESFKPAPAGKGAQLFRRSVYTFWRRNGPAPVLEAFDVPKRVVCVARRDTTNTPLHAFVLLNGPQFVEAARVLAEKLFRNFSSRPDELITQAVVNLLGRPPAEAERRVLRRLFTEQLDWYRRHPEDADCYRRTGDTSPDITLPAPEVAAATTLINTLMNHDNFAVKR